MTLRIHLLFNLFFFSGGQISNFYGMVLARHKLRPEIKSKGLYGQGKQLVTFISHDVSLVVHHSRHVA